MGDTLSAVWEQVSSLLQAGVSVIPVRDREVNGKPPKTPYHNWKHYQSQIIAPQALWEMMETHDTTAIAMICGKVSGNLEAIDIDVKNWPGIDARYFEAIRDMYPVLWESLRIHSTPSGGYHILYRIDRPGPGNQKLATAANSTQAGIETRGEGGYIVAPPSLGYQVHRDNPIPLLTWEQREALICLAKSFNEKVKVIPPPSLPKPKVDYYDENPFEHFNGSDPAEQILDSEGWSRPRSGNSRYRYFTRPGKAAGISASFNVGTRLYYIFTSSTILEPSRAYSPASLLCRLRFNGDQKETYLWLVANGYGRIKPHVEQRIVRARVLSGDELPGNISDEGKATFLQTKERLSTAYPHGTYWVQEADDDAVKINRERLYTVASNLGFRHYNGKIVELSGYIVRQVTDRYFFDALKAYCVEEEPDFLEAIRNAFEAFIQNCGKFTITRICLLNEDFIMCSDKRQSYKFYKNCFLGITSAGKLIYSYDKVKEGWYIWEHQILQRDYISIEGDMSASLYYQFLDKAIGVTDYLWQMIGYLAHDYKDETMGYFVMLVEQCEDPREGGGTGKNLFCNLLSHITTTKNISGSQVQLNEKLLQAWNYERLLVISDVPKHFNFQFFKEISMGSGTLKKLYFDEAVIPPEKMPKLVFSTNYSWEETDGGIKRRIRPIEFTSFFTVTGGVDTHFGKLFPYDWDPAEWAAYDHLMHQAIQSYLATGGKVAVPALSAGGWMKQFDQTYNFATRGFIQEYWDGWVRSKFVNNEIFKQSYDLYCNSNGIANRWRLTSYRLHAALKEWATHHDVIFNSDEIQRQNNVTIRGKTFRVLEEAPF
jgi:hypothetical protein